MKKPIAKLKLRVDTIRSLTAKEQKVVIGGAGNDTVSAGYTECLTTA